MKADSRNEMKTGRLYLRNWKSQLVEIVVVGAVLAGMWIFDLSSLSVGSIFGVLMYIAMLDRKTERSRRNEFLTSLIALTLSAILFGALTAYYDYHVMTTIEALLRSVKAAVAIGPQSWPNYRFLFTGLLACPTLAMFGFLKLLGSLR